MARIKSNPNQLTIDFLASHRRMLVSLGSADKLVYNEAIFTRLTDQWESKQVIPADFLFQKSPVEAVMYRMQKSDERLRFPNEMIAGELRGVESLTGFAAKFREQGWLILPAELTGMYKNLFLNILTAAIGLEYLYTNRQELLKEAERVALAALLPEAEMRNFFSARLSRFPDSFRSEVSAYFNLPFEYVLKRAVHIGAITEEVAEDNLTNRQPIRTATLRRPNSSRAA